MASFAEIARDWLWRWLPSSDNSKTVPLRLVYALPQGSVVEPVVTQVRDMLAGLGLGDEVGLHVSMGTWASSEGPGWREDMHRPAIVIGTAEVLVSKALNRAFGVGPGLWPIDFALVTSGAHWVIHDAALSEQAVTTLRQVEAATHAYGTAGPFELTVLPRSRERLPVYPRLRGVERDGLPALGVMEPVAIPADPVALLELPELLEFFDTSAEAVQAGPDVVPYVSDRVELDVAVAWATWTAGPDGAPDPEVRLPAAEYRCPVPLSAVSSLAAGRLVWHRDREGCWVPVSAAASEVRPFEVLLVSAADGGYHPVAGFDPSSREPVPDSPVLRTPDEQAALLAGLAADAGDGVDVIDPAQLRPWQTLDSHSEEVRDQAEALLTVLRPAVPARAAASAVVAGYLHDVGKGHQTWQDAVCALAPDEDQPMVQEGRPWAKSGRGASGRLEFAGGVSFRHELASLLLLDSSLRGLLAAAADMDLCRYLVLAHHGRLRTRVRDPDAVVPGVIYGLAPGAVSPIPPILGQPASTLTVDLAQFGDECDGGAWQRMVRGLLERYGLFRLAYLEAVVRVADWRASGGRELPVIVG